MKIRMTTALMVMLFLVGMMAIAIPIKADTGRFNGMSYAYRVETQDEVDALPSSIDASGKHIGVLVEGSDLIINGFAISGASQHCIAVDGQHNVTVSHCNIQGSLVGIYYYASAGAISKNTVYAYAKNGITANLPSGDGDSVGIVGNTVTGRGHVGAGDWAQNGIQIGYGAEGKVMDNQVSDHWYDPADWAASGILIFESDDCIVQGNVLENNQVGVAIETWCWFVSSASNNKVTKNTITGGQVGVSVAAYAWVYSTGNSKANNNKVVNNDIINQEVGVIVGAYDTSNAFDASAKNNKVNNNSFSNVVDEIIDQGSATKIHPV